MAAPQHGVVTRRQLLQVGLGKDAITYRVRSGRLHRLHDGVYAVGHCPPSPLARAMAGVLACAPGAVLSHHAAAKLWELVARWRTPLDVTARKDRRRPGIRVHVSRTLTDEDVTIHFGIPVTTVARTLLALADVLDDRALSRAVNDAQIKHRLALDEVAVLVARSPGRATTRLTPFVARHEPPTRSVLEDSFLAFVDRYGLPRPEANEEIAGYEVDMLWRDHSLIVELDSRTFHDTDQAFERDRAKDAELLVAGYRVVRITWRRLTEAPDREAARLEALLSTTAAARASARPRS